MAIVANAMPRDPNVERGKYENGEESKLVVPVFFRVSAANDWELKRPELTLCLVPLEVVVEVAPIGRSLCGQLAHIQELLHLRVL